MMHRGASKLLALAVLISARAAPAQNVPTRADDLRQYTDCNFGENIAVEEIDERDQPFVRSVPTAAGTKDVIVLHGISLHIAYAGTPFVNFKAEHLDHFDSAKQNLIESLRFAAAGTSDIETKTPQRSSLNGFDIRAINRTTLSGGVESVYLLLRNADQTVVTLYILNTPPEAPRFSTIEQHRALRDRFVRTYTACVGKRLAQLPAGTSHTR